MNTHLAVAALVVIAIANALHLAVGLAMVRHTREVLNYYKARDAQEDARRSKEQPKYFVMAKLDDPEGMLSKTIPDPPLAPEQPGEPWTK